ncbi:hypothetical protein PPYR_01441 [Photinus pyralis]|uniref:Uncharacterized protein n=1 Tax=Photinus pyralis TaxID=7054 RepID=A0A5N4AR46_PHOPY|nr:hypothetical protein PPYR_07659 [Photinus pyralis]KAB0804471.1 hypothetical protein PPYR_01441 [Photinus pyralis]
MDDYLVYGPSCSSTRKNVEAQGDDTQPFKFTEYFETLDVLTSELQRRFSDNADLLNSLASLDELDVEKMEPLKNLGITIPSREEATVVKAYLSRREEKQRIYCKFYTDNERHLKIHMNFWPLWQPWGVALPYVSQHFQR